MSFPNITIKRGDTLYPIAMVAWVDKEKTTRVDLTGVTLEASVRAKKDGALITQLSPTIELAADYHPTVSDENGAPLTGECVVLTMLSSETDGLEVGTHKWELKLVFPTGDEQTLVAGDFIITDTLNA